VVTHAIFLLAACGLSCVVAALVLSRRRVLKEQEDLLDEEDWTVGAPLAVRQKRGPDGLAAKR
jgi:hypothetical protein